MASTDRIILATVKEGLTLQTVDELKKLLPLLPIKDRPTKKADLVNTIAANLTGKGLKKIWQELNELQKAAVAEAVHVTEGVYQGKQFKAKYGQYPEWGTEDTSASLFYSYRRSVGKLDLFFYSTSRYGSGSTIPEDMRAELKSFVKKPKKLALKCLEEPPGKIAILRQYFDSKERKSIQTVEEVPFFWGLMEKVAQQDLLTMLRFVHLGKVSVSDKTFMPSKATIKNISAILQGGDYYTEADSQPEGDYQQPIGPIKAFAWPMILQGAGLAALDGKKLQLTNTGQKALKADPAKTIKTIWKKWLKTTILDEFMRIALVKGKTGKGKRGLTALDKRRRAIAEVLMECPVEKWVRFEDLKDYAIATNKTFEVTRSPENLYLCESGYGNLYDIGGWSFLETAYMQCFLFEYAATLGLLDIAYISPYDAPPDEWSDYWGAEGFDFLSRYDGLFALKLTPLGAFCLGLEATYTASAITTQTTLRVLPNLDIVMAGQPLSPGENLMMETFTLKTSDAVWKLDRDVLLKATENGHSLKEFQDFLTQASAEKLPDTVDHFFKDCFSRSNSLQDRGLVKLVECADATLATLIAHDSRTKKYCQLGGDRYLMVSIADETRFRNAVRKLGYTLPTINNC